MQYSQTIAALICQNKNVTIRTPSHRGKTCSKPAENKSAVIKFGQREDFKYFELMLLTDTDKKKIKWTVARFTHKLL